MPYKLSDDGLCVVKDSGESVDGGCHTTHADALAHLRALEVNVEDAKALEPHVIRVRANPYGGPNNGRDEHKQFYSPATKFWEDKAPPWIPAVHYHGRNPDGTPAGEPDFVGKAFYKGKDASGTIYDVALDAASPMGKELASVPDAELGVSSGVIPATKRIAANGHVDSWMNGEISLFRKDPTVGRMPVNDYAVGTHIKALYSKAGLDMPNVGGANVNIVQQLIQFLQSIAMSGTEPDADDASRGQNAQPTARPITPATGVDVAQPIPANPPAYDAMHGIGNNMNAMPATTAPVVPSAATAPATGSGAVAPNADKQRSAHEHTHDHADGTRHDHAHGHDTGLHIHDHTHAAATPAIEPVKAPPVPELQKGKDMTNQVDDTMKALQASLGKRIGVEADTWATTLMKSGRMLPAEKASAVGLYTALALDSSMKADGGDSEQLAQFKLLMEQREPNMTAGDLDPTNLKAAGFDKPNANGTPTPDRTQALMNMTPLGRAVTKEQTKAHSR